MDETHIETLPLDACPECKGKGRIDGIPLRTPDGIDVKQQHCTACGGDGRKK
jgi:hypothetical protein